MRKEFRTPVAPLRHQGMISHATPLLMLGSCFATNIGERMRQDLMDVCVNPFGTLYNPASIAAACERLATRKLFTDDDIVERDGMLHSWHCHSSLSSQTSDREGYLRKLNNVLETLYPELCNVTTAVLTFGTRHLFRLKEQDMVVANCHKMPANCFVEEDLDVNQCATYINAAIHYLRFFNPAMKIILTVSPVRYVGEGLHKSTLTKSTLLLACEIIEKQIPSVIYFPSYEIMMDDLRDYRFYASDMKHPSEVAVDYVYSIFSESFFDTRTQQVALECRKLSGRMAHRSISVRFDELYEHQISDMANKLIENNPELAKTVNKLLKR